jgi:hypothetical protein
MDAAAPFLRAALGLGAPFAPFSATSGADRALLAARALLLLAAWWPARRRLFGVVAAALVASLAACGFFLPFVVAAFAVAWPDGRARAGAAVALVGCCLAGIASTGAPRAPERAADPAAETVAWIARDNLFQARYWATIWAATERGEGAGHLALATVDWELGHAAAARAIAEDVVARGNDDGVRQRAAAQLRAWAPAGEGR